MRRVRKSDRIAKSAVLLWCCSWDRAEQLEKFARCLIVVFRGCRRADLHQMKLANEQLDEDAKAINRVFAVRHVSLCATLDVRKHFGDARLFGDNRPGLRVVIEV